MNEKGKWIRNRVYVVCSAFIFVFAVILAKAYYLQIIKHEEYRKKTDDQYVEKVPFIPPRGIIYDRNYQELAVSLEMDSIYARPGLIKDKQRTACQLSPLLVIPEEDLKQRLQNKKSFIWLMRRIPPEQSSQVMKCGIKGIGTIEESRRFYPHRNLASTILGTTDIDCKGLEGIELTYNHYLRGKPGYLVMARDALGRDIFPEGIKVVDSEKGYSLVLTIDKIIQHIAEKELEKAVEESNAQGGMAVVMDPRTGEVLAMAVVPSFNPNQSFSEEFLSSCRKNRIVTDSFEPGSILKVFLVAGGLEEKVINLEDQFYCENGKYLFGRRLIHDVHKYGWLNVAEIVKYSSNIGACKIGENVGKECLYHYLRTFGFGQEAGIDIVGEVKGMIHPPEKWPKVALGNISFGQGISVTAIQLTSALSAIANGGLLMKPYLVKEIVDDSGKVVERFSPVVKRRVVSEGTARLVTSVMKMVVEEGGTGGKAALENFEVAGKTGTAQKVIAGVKGYSNKRIGSFMGFVPADNPRLAILVVIDEPKGISYGGVVAAPAFREIASQTVYYLKVFPDRDILRVEEEKKEEEKVVEKASFSAEAVDGLERELEEKMVPNFTGMSIRQVLKLGERYELNIKVTGSGRAVRQSLAPGSIICDKNCLVEFQPTS
jgi:cell division protein FtsI (penicillin-binding protein 3)